MPVQMAQRLVKGLRRVLHDLDPACIDARDAVALLDTFAEGERLCAAAKTLLARRVDESGIWKHEGYRSAAELVAAVSGTSVGQARQVVETGRRLVGGSKTEYALRTARLSQAQAHVVTSAAAAAPEAEDALLECAQSDGLAGLEQLSARVKDAVRSEEEREARHQRLHRRRCLRFWTDPDGAERGAWSAPPDAGARIRAAVRAVQEHIFRDARRGNREREHPDAYALDALLTLVDRPDPADERRPAPPATVMIRVDAERLQRAPERDDGICEIAGVGPVPVSVARDALGNDAMVKLVITKGVDVLNVTHIGRTRRAHVQSALDWTYDECGIVDCHRQVAIEWHHTKPYRTTRHTKLEELGPLCKFHHALVERDGYTLHQRPDREWDLIPPHRPETDARDDRAPPATV